MKRLVLITALFVCSALAAQPRRGGGPSTPRVPEIDPNTGASAIVLAGGALLLLRAGKR